MKKSGLSEYEIQCFIFAWADRERENHPCLRMLKGDIAGVKVTIGQMMKAKRAGFKAGYPDIILDVPRGGYHGLRIELKKEGGRMSQAQRDWMQALTEQGYYAYCCKGVSSALECLKKYLEMPHG